MAETQMKWYVLRAVSGKEAKVKEYLDAEINNNFFNGNVAQVLIPQEQYVSTQGGKKVTKKRNYLPGYVLVEAALVGEVAHTLRNTPNVLGFLGGLDNPTPVRESEIARIMGEDKETIPQEEIVNYLVGESVKVTDGPFSSFKGVIEEIMPDKRKLKVTVSIFGRNTPLELSYGQVEKEK